MHLDVRPITSGRVLVRAFSGFEKIVIKRYLISPSPAKQTWAALQLSSRNYPQRHFPFDNWIAQRSAFCFRLPDEAQR